MMPGKSYSSDTMKDGPRKPTRTTGLPFIRASELIKTNWTDHIGSTPGFCYDGGSRTGEFREGVLRTVTRHGLHTSISVVSDGNTWRYYLDRVGDVVIMGQPAAGQLALTDSQPDPDVPRVRGPDSVSASRRLVLKGSLVISTRQWGKPSSRSERLSAGSWQGQAHGTRREFHRRGKRLLGWTPYKK